VTDIRLDDLLGKGLPSFFPFDSSGSFTTNRPPTIFGQCLDDFVNLFLGLLDPVMSNPNQQSTFVSSQIDRYLTSSDVLPLKNAADLLFVLFKVFLSVNRDS
jgi:hypothetical protein